MSERVRSPLALVRTLALVVLMAPTWASSGADPLDLARAMALALDGPDVRVAALQFESARLAALAAGPQIAASVRTGYGASWRDGTLLDSSRPQAVTLSMTFNVVPLGSRGEAADRAAASLDAADRTFAAARAGAFLTAADRWWAAVRAQDEAELLRERRVLAERSVDALRVQVGAGTATGAALTEAELDLRDALLTESTARADAVTARLQLAQHLGHEVPALASRDEATLPGLATLLATALPARADLAAAAATSDRVRAAQTALRDALVAQDRTTRETGPSMGLAGSYAVAGEGGRVSVGAAWDTRSYQPGVDVSVDPFASAPAATTASISLSVSIPLSSTLPIERAQAALGVELALERLAQAEVTALLELTALARSAEAALGQVALADQRLEARARQLESLTVRSEFGGVAPLELDRAHLDRRAAGLALQRSLDTARLALARLEIALGRHPSAALGTLSTILVSPEVE